MVNISLRVLARPDASHLPQIYRTLELSFSREYAAAVEAKQVAQQEAQRAAFIETPLQKIQISQSANRVYLNADSLMLNIADKDYDITSSEEKKADEEPSAGTATEVPVEDDIEFDENGVPKLKANTELDTIFKFTKPDGLSLDDDERGLIINVSSSVATEGQTGQVTYAASSGAINSMTLPMARDLAPQKRIGKPEEFAQLVETLIMNKYINAEIIRLDAGLRIPP
ncbi:hypothetical protein RND71_043883 [Anisodus tanguticus]|uniref:Uncharacterized protein n=1 Tax=Anisodus tanguticus TaxID=243964 RepID=A0AAE1QNQ6_9SOLA|nr:hypothetical protein RND71_043883 [Anisodus tanguticus]